MSIARAIARAHDSDLQIKTRPDGGTIVTVLFARTP
ncbi:ATP-binding protein [Agrobacterium sp. LMR679]|nr:ATP-binding protein [Agrobacterium sp. LMR679]MCZ4072346.1 ATP-binding protein [Agrobacterium sp. LMR679]